MRLRRRPAESSSIRAVPDGSPPPRLNTLKGLGDGAPCRGTRRNGGRANSVVDEMSISAHQDTNQPTNPCGTRTNPFGDLTIHL